VEEVREELDLGARELRAARARLGRVGAVVASGVVLDDPHRHTSELARWDQRFPHASPGGGLGDLVVAGVRAAVVSPEAELEAWFSWRPDAELVARLVAAGRLERIGGELSVP
jgi:hypothetical protein